MSKDKKEKVDKEVVVESPEKVAFRKRLETYQAENPKAWEIRGERLLAKLEAMV